MVSERVSVSLVREVHGVRFVFRGVAVLLLAGVFFFFSGRTRRRRRRERKKKKRKMVPIRALSVDVPIHGGRRRRVFVVSVGRVADRVRVRVRGRRVVISRRRRRERGRRGGGQRRRSIRVDTASDSVQVDADEWVR